MIYLFTKYINAPIHVKLIYLAIFGHALSPVVQFVEKFLWNDWDFVVSLAVMVTLDTICGLWRAWREGSISSKALGRVFIKIIVYAIVLIAVHSLTNFTVHGERNSIIAAIIPYFDAVCYGSIMIREALSIVENLSKLGHKVLPNFILKRLTDFDENGLPTKAGQKTENNG